MKKLLLLLGASALFTTLVGCSSESQNEDKLSIYTSFFAMEDFTKKIGGDKVSVTSIVPANSEVHDYEPTTGDIVNISEADLFIYNGAGLEHFIDSLKSALTDSNVKFLETSEGVNLLTADDGVSDSHVWLSPINAKAQLKNIKDALVEIDEENETYYQDNYDFYANELDNLDEQYRSLLINDEDRYLVTSHAAFGYLANEYNLIALPIGGYDDEEEPAEQNIAKVIDTIKENNIAYVYAESYSPSSTVETVIDETGAKLGILNTLESLDEDGKKLGLEYVSIMRNNLIEIAKGYVNN